MILRGVAAVLALSCAACTDCWVAPVLDATAVIELDGDDPAAARASLAARLGELSGCDSGRAEHDDSATTDFEPYDDRVVTFQPDGGEPLRLDGEGAGRYTADADGYAAHYTVVADGTELLLPIAPFFTAEVVQPPGELPYVQLSNTYSPTSAHVVQEEVGGWQATVDGDRVTFDPATIEEPGEYQVRIVREDWGNLEYEDAAESAWIASDLTLVVSFTIAP